MAGVKRAIRLA